MRPISSPAVQGRLPEAAPIRRCAVIGFDPPVKSALLRNLRRRPAASFRAGAVKSYQPTEARPTPRCSCRQHRTLLPLRIDAELELRALAAERPVAVADLKEAELELESPATTQTSEETRLATLMQQRRSRASATHRTGRSPVRPAPGRPIGAVGLEPPVPERRRDEPPPAA